MPSRRSDGLAMSRKEHTNRSITEDATQSLEGGPSITCMIVNGDSLIHPDQGEKSASTMATTVYVRLLPSSGGRRR